VNLSTAKCDVLETTNDPSPAALAVQQHIQRVFVVFNPVAGLTKAENARQTIENFCKEQGWECEIHETKPEDDLRQVVLDALKREVDLVLASGGDGTVSGVVTGMVNSGKPMGILPAGTGNLLARDLGIPLPMEEALALYASPHAIQPLDVMETNGEDYFVLNVSVGLSSLIMRRTGREEKRRFGMLAYLWKALQSLFTMDIHHFRVRVDEKDYRFGATEVMIANHRLMGLQPKIDGVEIDPSDGRLDLFIVRARHLRDYLDIIVHFIIPSRRNEDPRLVYIPIKKNLHLESEFPLAVQADGEDMGLTPLNLRLIPGALLVVTPIKEK
jgi:diacylglycerol kinase (ATP)